jgi:hypothetical protein
MLFRPSMLYHHLRVFIRKYILSILIELMSLLLSHCLTTGYFPLHFIKYSLYRDAFQTKIIDF